MIFKGDDVVINLESIDEMRPDNSLVNQIDVIEIYNDYGQSFVVVIGSMQSTRSFNYTISSKNFDNFRSGMLNMSVRSTKNGTIKRFEGFEYFEEKSYLKYKNCKPLLTKNSFVLINTTVGMEISTGFMAELKSVKDLSFTCSPNIECTMEVKYFHVDNFTESSIANWHSKIGSIVDMDYKSHDELKIYSVVLKIKLASKIKYFGIEGNVGFIEFNRCGEKSLLFLQDKVGI